MYEFLKTSCYPSKEAEELAQKRYEGFGWEVISMTSQQKVEGRGSDGSVRYSTTTDINLRREKDMPNYSELVALENKAGIAYDNCTSYKKFNMLVIFMAIGMIMGIQSIMIPVAVSASAIGALLLVVGIIVIAAIFIIPLLGMRKRIDPYKMLKVVKIQTIVNLVLAIISVILAFIVEKVMVSIVYAVLLMGVAAILHFIFKKQVEKHIKNKEAGLQELTAYIQEAKIYLK